MRLLADVSPAPDMRLTAAFLLARSRYIDTGGESARLSLTENAELLR